MTTLASGLRFPGSLAYAAKPPGAVRMLHPDDPCVLQAHPDEDKSGRFKRAYALYPDGRVSRSDRCGQRLLPLSSVDPVQAPLLAYERDPGRWESDHIFAGVPMVGPTLDGVVGRILHVGFGTNGFETAPILWIDVDRPSELCAWMAGAIPVFRRAFGRVCMNYGLGISSWGSCRYCGEAMTDRDGWQSWFDFSVHDACRVEALAVPRRKKPKRTGPNIGAYDTLPPDARTRAALHRVYGGECQYCRVAVSMDGSEVEHVVPRSVPIEAIASVIVASGVSEDAAMHFVRGFAPPIHDCASNYLLACRACNGRKSDVVLSLVSLELLLRRARSHADAVLRARSGVV